MSASSLLIEKEFYASSIHCSYYAVFQHLTCFLNLKMKLSFEDIIKNSKGPGSHDYVINQTISFLNQSISETDLISVNIEKYKIQKIRKKICDLKLLRIQSDYHNLLIDNNISDKAHLLSKEIISKI